MTVKSMGNKRHFLWGTDKPTFQRRRDIRVNLGDHISGDNKQDPPKKNTRSSLQTAIHGDHTCFYGAKKKHPKTHLTVHSTGNKATYIQQEEKRDAQNYGEQRKKTTTVMMYIGIGNTNDKTKGQTHTKG